ncbi:hypothetical protein [Stutzerimonas stutzeri]|uniref:hypothetical protein n=1 Tax=Stutzerimonas stutzeri TaxID=316 RepID=UPI0015E3E60A|nr:hypothetical protein [Stutzerimonas stutzeri]MBA1280299.1 hypothetical protein [Stutzerimonas stutzeri]
MTTSTPTDTAVAISALTRARQFISSLAAEGAYEGVEELLAEISSAISILSPAPEPRPFPDSVQALSFAPIFKAFNCDGIETVIAERIEAAAKQGAQAIWVTAKDGYRVGEQLPPMQRLIELLPSKGFVLREEAFQSMPALKVSWGIHIGALNGRIDAT